MAPSSPTTVSEQIKQVPPAVRPILLAVRRSIRAIAPAASEVAYQGGPPRSASFMWKIARYRVNGKNVVGFGTFPRHATLFFYRGRELDEGSGLLQGSGKDTRFVTLRSAADAETAAIKRLLSRAFKLD